ncbi:MAG TPA: pitrilysin family protein [Polyangiaceae bacterium]|nr:pitrilysin family protein [Polyangiaceae bacterium]
MRTLLPVLGLSLLAGFGVSSPSDALAATPKLLGQSKGTVKPDPGRVKQNIPVQFAPRKPGPPPAKVAAPATTDPAVLSLERFGASIQRTVLDNGLKVVLNPDHSAPTVAVSVTYKVGSSNEVEKRTGFAHLFEHMMFQGSKHAAKGVHFKLIADRGGNPNGTTNSDRTNYFEVLPANELELALWLEADRMRWLSVTPENFENQRAVVQEEFRMRIQNQPYVPGTLRLGELVFQDYPAYAHAPIGSMADLDAAKFEWVKEFHDQYYAPDNAVLTIAGDFEPDQALNLVQKYFGSAKSQTAPPRVLPVLPEQPKTGRATVEDNNARTPGFMFGFMIPPSRTPDHYALEIAAAILTNGESSRLYKQLVHDRAVVDSISAWTDGHRGADQFSVMGVLTDKGQLSEVEAAVDAELTRLQKTPPSSAELEKAKRQLRARFVFGLQTNNDRAIRLGAFEASYSDARLLARELSQYLAVTPEAVQQAAARYLTAERRSLVEVLPLGKPGKAGKP